MSDPGTGIHRMTRERYDELDRASWSIIKPIGRSPAHALQALKGKTSPALSMGIACHLAILEPDEFSKCAVWGGEDRRTKAGKEAWARFELESAGKTVLTIDEWATARDMAASVRASAQAMAYLSEGEAEVSVLWSEGDVACKARLDWRCRAILDVKSTNDASPRGFGAQVARYDYLGQLAMYQRAVEVTTGERLPCVLLAVEKEPPYVAQVYRVADELLLLGRGRYESLLTKWAQCRRADKWGGYSETELELRLPPWAFADDWSVSNGPVD